MHSLSVDASFCVELESNLFKCALQFLPCSVLVQFVFAILQLIIVHGYITDNDARKNTYTPPLLTRPLYMLDQAKMIFFSTKKRRIKTVYFGRTNGRNAPDSGDLACQLARFSKGFVTNSWHGICVLQPRTEFIRDFKNALFS